MKMSNKLLDAVSDAEVRFHRAGARQLEVKQEQQEWSSGRDQEDPPELPHIKEEQEELRISQEGEQPQGLEEADIIKFTVKSEDEEDEEKPQLSQLPLIKTEEIRDAEYLKTEADEEPEPDRKLNPGGHLQPDPPDKTSHSEPETDDSCDWEETREPESGSNPEVITGQTERCSTTFRNKRHPQNHTEIQPEEKPFSCSVCGKRYLRKKSLTTHMRVHSEGKRFSCSVCQKTFQKKEHVVSHMRIHTGEKPFCCSFCGTRFTQSSTLKAHLRVHTGEKPFTCSVCQTSFRLSSSLYKHMRSHTGDKPFGCSVCGKRFTRASRIKKHKCVVESS